MQEWQLTACLISQTLSGSLVQTNISGGIKDDSRTSPEGEREVNSFISQLHALSIKLIFGNKFPLLHGMYNYGLLYIINIQGCMIQFAHKNHILTF